jgi:hypothetical protein
LDTVYLLEMPNIFEEISLIHKLNIAKFSWVGLQVWNFLIIQHNDYI